MGCLLKVETRCNVMHRCMTPLLEVLFNMRFLFVCDIGIYGGSAVKTKLRPFNKVEAN